MSAKISVKLKDGKPINITNKLQRETKDKLEKVDKYIEDIIITDDIKKKRIVTIDPGYKNKLNYLIHNKKILFKEILLYINIIKWKI